MKLSSFECKFKSVFKMGMKAVLVETGFGRKWYFSKNNILKKRTPLTFSDFYENWALTKFKYADFKNQIGLAVESRNTL